MYRRYVKRGMDGMVALFLLLLLLPFLLLIALISSVVHRGGLLFCQERVGRDGRHFRMLKFRTMTDGRDSRGELFSDELRTTPFGRFLRRYSLDELPQVWHVLTGKMSLVGPRPLLPEHVSACTPEEYCRHTVRPGITGLAQVCGRNEIPFGHRFRYDMWYVKNMSIKVDFYVFCQTFSTIIRHECRKSNVKRNN